MINLLTIALQLGSTRIANPVANSAGNATSIGGLITNALNFFIYPFAFLISLIFMGIGAFRIIVSNGDANAVKAGRGMIINCIIGLILISLAYVITNFISTNLLNTQIIQ